MEQNNTRTCPKDCTKCSECQRLYCAATWSRLLMERMDEMDERFERLENKVDSLDHADEGVFDPMNTEAEEVSVENQEVVEQEQAQPDSGATE